MIEQRDLPEDSPGPTKWCIRRSSPPTGLTFLESRPPDLTPVWNLTARDLICFDRTVVFKDSQRPAVIV